MSHNHANCTNPLWGAVCIGGALGTYCNDDQCDNEFCENLGHCECKCHSGKTCLCGYKWPRMVAVND